MLASISTLMWPTFKLPLRADSQNTCILKIITMRLHCDIEWKPLKKKRTKVYM